MRYVLSLAMCLAALGCEPTRATPRLVCTTDGDCPASGQYHCDTKTNLCQPCDGGCTATTTDTTSSDTGGTSDVGNSDIGTSDNGTSDLGKDGTVTSDGAGDLSVGSADDASAVDAK
jgi:hypothetical protein